MARDLLALAGSPRDWPRLLDSYRSLIPSQGLSRLTDLCYTDHKLALELLLLPAAKAKNHLVCAFEQPFSDARKWSSSKSIARLAFSLPILLSQSNVQCPSHTYCVGST